MSERIDRRSFLKQAGLVTGGSVIAAACSTPATQTPGSGGGAGTGGGGAAASAAPANSKAWLPTFVQAKLPTPDFAPNDKGVPAGYTSYPKTLLKSVAQTPGRGGNVTGAVQLVGTPPPPVASNAAWQAINKALNVNLQINLIPSNDYTPKSAALMASGDIPDFFYLERDNSVANTPELMKAAFADLTPHLTGDKVKDYPNLAALPTGGWEWPSVNKTIYAIPIPRHPYNWIPFTNLTRWEAIGNPVPKNWTDFKKAMVDLTRPREDQYGFGAIAPHFGLVTSDGMNFMAMFKVPHNWRVDPATGKFTKDFETDEFKTAVSSVRDLYAAGVFYPNANATLAQLRTLLTQGKIALTYSGWLAYGPLLWDVAEKQTPPLKIRTLPTFSYDGSRPLFYAYHGVNGMTYIKKQSDPERLKELLRIANWFAAPFGSEEYQLANFGVQGVDFNLNAAGLPVLTQAGQADMQVGWNRLITCMPILGPASAEFIRTAHGYAASLTEFQIPDATNGLYSATAKRTGQRLIDRFHEGIGEIVRGRAPETSLATLLSDWRSGGGDTIRKEYEQAYADSKK